MKLKSHNDTRLRREVQKYKISMHMIRIDKNNLVSFKPVSK